MYLTCYNDKFIVNYHFTRLEIKQALANSETLSRNLQCV